MTPEMVKLRTGSQVARTDLEAVLHELRIMDEGLLYFLAMKSRLPSFQASNPRHPEDLVELGFLDRECNAFGSYVDRGIKPTVREIVLAATELIEGEKRVRLWPPGAEQYEQARQEEAERLERARREEAERAERARQEEAAQAERARKREQRWKRWLQRCSPVQVVSLAKRLAGMPPEVLWSGSREARETVADLFESAAPVLVEVRSAANLAASPAWYLCQDHQQFEEILEQLSSGVELRLHSVWDLQNMGGEVCLRK